MSVNLQKAEFVRSAAKAGDFPRDRLPQVAFAGRSNVGKSSAINRLLGRIYEDFPYLRRLLIEYGFLERTASGSAYWRKE